MNGMVWHVVICFGLCWSKWIANGVFLFKKKKKLSGSFRSIYVVNFAQSIQFFQDMKLQRWVVFFGHPVQNPNTPDTACTIVICRYSVS